MLWIAYYSDKNNPNISTILGKNIFKIFRFLSIFISLF